MSHYMTALAMKQQGLKPATKIGLQIIIMAKQINASPA